MRRVVFAIVLMSAVLWGAFSRNGEVVSDHATGLHWQDNNRSDRLSWQGAIDACEALVLGDQSDWRLPNINELLSLANYTKGLNDPKVDEAFEYMLPSYYLSSTSVAQGGARGWSLNFSDGGVYNHSKSATANYLCVRGGAD
jgi:hypothetical protein